MSLRRITTTVATFVLATILTGCTPGCQKPAGDDTADVDAMPPPPPPDAAPAFNECADDGPGFVREASLALLGHRVASQHEVDAYVALYNQVAAAAKAGTTTDAPRAAVARAMLARPERNQRWTAHFMDALHVTRIEDQNQRLCWGASAVSTVDPALATFVRDNLASKVQAKPATMLDVARSAIALDDPTPMYRAQLFTLVAHPIPAANVIDEGQAERARREDYGNAFDAAYLNRDVVCLGCHNSEFSITDNVDPLKDRSWPLAGHVDQALFGMSTGEDPAAAHAVFRYRNFAEGGSLVPWGLSEDCGTFANPAGLPIDPAGVNGLFGSMMGQKLTVYDLDKALKKGFDTLRGGALVVGPDGVVADKDAALAYVVATNIVEGVWREVIGTKLTIANYFPRNQASRDLLQTLTDRFIANRYSLDALLVDIVSTDYFARKPAEAGCGPNPYSYPAVYDPWVIADTDPLKHGNGPGDAVAPVSARTLLSAAYAALEWTPPDDEQFPMGGPFDQPSPELEFLRSIGVFLKNGERGFRGLDFQARLGWEDRFGTCAKPSTVTGDDLVDRALAAGQAATGATVGDVVALIKDRLVGEPTVELTTEAPAIAALVGQPLTAPATSLTGAGLRRFCGVLMSSPQFVLQGLPARGGAAPSLTLSGDGFDDTCARIAGAKLKGWTVTCAAGTLTATPAP